jgi:hypothetical protein
MRIACSAEFLDMETRYPAFHSKNYGAPRRFGNRDPQHRVHLISSGRE